MQVLFIAHPDLQLKTNYLKSISKTLEADSSAVEIGTVNTRTGGLDPLQQEEEN